MVLLFEDLRADVTPKRLPFANAVNTEHMTLQVAFLCKFPAANLALISGARMLRSDAALSMRRDVVSVDR